jgi:hypothetical protein
MTDHPPVRDPDLLKQPAEVRASIVDSILEWLLTQAPQNRGEEAAYCSGLIPVPHRRDDFEAVKGPTANNNMLV